MATLDKTVSQLNQDAGLLDAHQIMVVDATQPPGQRNRRIAGAAIAPRANPVFSGFVAHSSATGLLPVGSTAAAALQLGAERCHLNGANAADGTGVRLHAAAQVHKIWFRTGVSHQVWPPDGHQIEGTSGINQPVTLGSGSTVEFFQYTPGHWIYG